MQLDLYLIDTNLLGSNQVKECWHGFVLTTFTVNLENVNGSVGMAKFGHDGMDTLGYKVVFSNSLHLPVCAYSPRMKSGILASLEFFVQGWIKRMRFTLKERMYSFLELNIIVTSNGIHQAFFLWLFSLLIANEIYATDKLGSISKGMVSDIRSKPFIRYAKCFGLKDIKSLRSFRHGQVQRKHRIYTGLTLSIELIFQLV
mmetsp:Transcript_39101/g.94531  ORF Transcript_39101/g.94531 Transcript_39101/m.94531 type:complete len:201 (-) Transcript_39101:266-868(-)